MNRSRLYRRVFGAAAAVLVGLGLVASGYTALVGSRTATSVSSAVAEATDTATAPIMVPDELIWY